MRKAPILQRETISYLTNIRDCFLFLKNAVTSPSPPLITEDLASKTISNIFNSTFSLSLRQARVFGANRLTLSPENYKPYKDLFFNRLSKKDIQWLEHAYHFSYQATREALLVFT